MSTWSSLHSSDFAWDALLANLLGEDANFRGIPCKGPIPPFYAKAVAFFLVVVKEFDKLKDL